MLLILLSILLLQNVRGYKQSVADTLQARIFGVSSSNSKKLKASAPTLGQPQSPRGFMAKLAQKPLKAAPKQSGSFYRPSSSNIPTIEPCQRLNCHLSIVVVLDSSTSVRKSNFVKQLRFVETFLQILALKADAAGLKVCTGIVRYSSKAQIIVNPCCDNSLCSVLTQVNKIQYVKGSTNTAGALKVARQMLQAPASYKKVALLITDGKSTRGGSPVDFAADMRKEDNIDVVALGVTNSVNRDELLGISGYDYVTKIEDFDEFHDLALELLEANAMDEGDIDKICESDKTTFKETCPRDEEPSTSSSSSSSPTLEQKTCTWGSWSVCVLKQSSSGIYGKSQGPGISKICVQRRTCKLGNKDIDYMEMSCRCGNGVPYPGLGYSGGHP